MTWHGIRPRLGLAVLLLLVVVGAAAALGRVEVALAGAHVPPAVSGGVGDIASVGRIMEPEVSTEVAKGWATYDAALVEPGPMSSTTLRWMYLALDVALMFSLSCLLVMSRARLLSRSDRAEDNVGGGAAARRRVADLSLWAIGLYFLADLVETALATTAPITAATAAVIGGASLLKWFALLAVVLMLVMGTRRGRQVGKLAAGVPGVKALRGQILVALLLVGLLVGMSGDLGRQIDDVLVVAADTVMPALIATILMLVTTAAIHLGGRACLAAYRATPEVHAVTSGYRKVWGVAIVLGIVAAALWRWAEAVSVSVATAAGALAAWALLSAPRLVRSFTRRASDGHEVGLRTRQGLAMVTTLPAVALYVATVRATTSQATSGTMSWFMTFWSVACLAIAFRVARWTYEGARKPLALPEPSKEESSRNKNVAVKVLVGCLALGVLVALSAEHEWWSWLGTPTVVVLFAALLASAVGATVVLSDEVAPRGALAMMGFRRMPFLAMVALWGLIASVADTEGRYYDARTFDRATTGDAGPARTGLETPDAAFTRWLAATNDGSPKDTPQTTGATSGATPQTTGATAEATPRQEVPIVFVASAGGGIRSAYWTARTWDCAIGTTCGQSVDHTADVFFASGVSGGAVGLAQVRARQAGGGDVGGSGSGGGADWVDEAMSADFLAPSVAAFLFRDLPNSVARLPFPGRDRAATLEKAFEHEQTGLEVDFLGSAATFPILSFSAVSVEDGCRLAVSTVQQEANSGETNCTGADIDLPGKAGPGSAPVRDAGDFLCLGGKEARSLSLSTAAFLSARFPLVAPSGGLRTCGEEDPVTFALDGGVFDNSGGAAVTRMWNAIAKQVRVHNAKGGSCVVPRLLVIDSHYATGRATGNPGRPLQSIGPVVALGNVYEERSSRALAEATRTIKWAAKHEARRCGLQPDPDSAVAQVYPQSTSGPQGPLGWTLSESSRRDLTTQVFGGCDVEPTQADTTRRHNCTSVAVAHSWFTARAN